MPSTFEEKPLVLHKDGRMTTDHTEDELAFFRSWRPTSFPIQKDAEESQRVGKAIRAASSQCWFNARKAVQRLPDYVDASYVEGWVIVGCGLIIEHGWLVKDDRIIDPTLPFDPIRYFPGLEFKGRAGIDEFLQTPRGKKCKKSPFFFAFGWAGMRSPGIRGAYDQCLKAATGECSVTD